MFNKNLKWSDDRFTSRFGEVLALSVSEPRNARATVLMLPGFTSKRLNSTNTHVAKMLRPHGFRCVAMDPSGHGDSEGLIEDQGIIKARDEILDAIKYLDEGSSVGSSYSVLGNSFSGNAAILAAGESARIQALALKSPVTDYVSMRFAQLGPDGMERWRRDGRIVLPDGTASKYSFIEQAESVSTLAVLERLKIPVLAIQGSEDEQIPESSRNDLRAVMDRSGMDYRLLAGGDHNLSDPHFRTTVELISNFLLGQLA